VTSGARRARVGRASDACGARAFASARAVVSTARDVGGGAGARAAAARFAAAPRGAAPAKNLPRATFFSCNGKKRTIHFNGDKKNSLPRTATSAAVAGEVR
jgi:hypothetical protein